MILEGYHYAIWTHLIPHPLWNITTLFLGVVNSRVQPYICEAIVGGMKGDIFNEDY